jgi:L-ascorbate metabolism protein UlaG (beta-lactamase superfamily)
MNKNRSRVFLYSTVLVNKERSSSMRISKRIFVFFLPSLLVFGGICSVSKAMYKTVDSVSDSLHYIGHSSVEIKTSDGKIIYIDPFQGTAADYPDSADIILVTHGHYDHNNVNLVTRKSTCTVITYVQSNINGVYQSFNVGNIKIYSVAAYNQYHPKNQCVGYVLEFNGIKFYHAGDTGEISEMASLADSNITYALLPIDSIYTMSPAQATDAAGMIKAAHNIPIHTQPPPDSYNEDKVSRFLPDNRILIRPGETIALSSQVTDVENNSSGPLNFRLYQSYPNPFNPSTTISFSIPSSSFVTLKIYDINGREVAALVSEQLASGNYSRKWNALNMPSGVYFYRLQAGEFTNTKKFVLLK